MLYILGVILIALYWVDPTSGVCVPEGTTPDIRKLLIGRCVEFQTIVNPGQFCENSGSTKKNCTDLAEKFLSAFSGQPPCNVTFDRYNDFIQAARHDVTVDKSLFWSGVYSFVHTYSNRGKRGITLEDTLIGYMVDSLSFCGQENGITFGQACPGFYPTPNCSSSASFAFWAMASRNFASQAHGSPSVMLNSSRDEPFRNNSFFATWEVPNLNPATVSKLNILMVHIPGQRIVETCSGPTITELKRRLEAKNIKWSCDDNPRDAQWLLCLDTPKAKKCQLAPTSGTRLQKVNSFNVFFAAFLLKILGVAW